MLSLSGRGAIVAGTRRLGARVVERLADEGVNLAIVYRRSRAEAEALLESVRPRVEHACLVQADLAVEADVRDAIAEARRELGELSICVNLASDFPRVALRDLDAAAWDLAMGTAKASYLLLLHAARAMMANPGPTRGHLINFGDWASGETPYTDYLPYLTAKAAVLFMSRAFAVELAPHGILVNTISPGPSARPDDLTSAEWQEALAESPLHRESSIDDMAETIVTLLKLETITGEDIRIDSGRHIAGAGRPRASV